MAYPGQGDSRLWLSWVGLETELIFNQGVDLPGFASFPLLEANTGRARLEAYYSAQIKLARDHGCGASLESVTWMANADRARALGYDQAALDGVNRDAIDLIAGLKDGDDICLSAQIGPRGDGYKAGEMTAEASRRYHAAQINVLADTAVDVLSAYTIASVDEATGIVQAAGDVGKPVIVSFTVETDGALPDGTLLSEAITRVDGATGGAAACFLVNCAHPDHIDRAAVNGRLPDRLAGVVANASRCSHAELDEAEELDDGDPVELGQQLAELRRRHPAMSLLGGCCGTDLRHLREIAAGAVRD